MPRKPSTSRSGKRRSRKAPKTPASKFPGKTKTGLDKRKWRSVRYAKGYKWIRVNARSRRRRATRNRVKIDKGKIDIGTFATHEGTPGVEFLMGGANPPSNLQVEYPGVGPYLRVFHMDGTCVYPPIVGSMSPPPTPSPLISESACTTLITHIDEASTQQTYPATTDIRVPISQSELERLIGATSVHALINLFPCITNTTTCKMVLRRCSAHGMCINFHRDNALHTVQVALNGDDQYDGGRLVYATPSGVFIPHRPTGAVTVHNNGIVHGVTKLEEGVRYGLFLLFHQPRATL